MSFYEELLENDLNPFILFNGDGKIKNFNKEAEFLFNFTTPKELFNLAISYASTTFGFQQEFISVRYEKQSFYAILVGYLTEDEIILRLYKEVLHIEPLKIDNNLQLTNIFPLIELSKNTTLLNSNIKIEEIYDVSIPEIKLDINKFLVTLNSIFEQLIDIKDIQLKVYIKTGEYEIIDKKRYNIIAIEFISDEIINFEYNLSSKKNLDLIFCKNKIKLEIPLIQ
ncbi:MAG: hypothetical protein KAJ49_07370 [Arcobacteraceae bacterium]|nr:hypothetical protein [Arcobacteraceae bacterium]